MNYIVLDIEATDNKPKEIIEIGAVKLDSNLEVIDTFQSFVKPTINPELGWFIKKLTNISQKQVDNADIFPTVHEKFVQWVGEDSMIITWGKEDKKFVNRNLIQYDLKSVILQQFVNIQNIVTSIMKHSPGVIGLKAALQECEIVQEGQHHRALDDALNTSKIFVKFFHQLGDLKEIQKYNAKSEKMNKLSNNIIFNKSIKCKINFKRYFKYLSKLSVFELKSRLKMLENKLESELQKTNGVSNYLSTIIFQKRNCVKKILSTKTQNLALEEAGLTLKQIEVPFKVVNELFTLKDKLIIKKNIQSKVIAGEVISQIEKLKKILSKINKATFNNHNKDELIQYNEEILQLMSNVLQSEHFKVKYKLHIERLHEKVRKNFDSLQPYVQQAM